MSTFLVSVDFSPASYNAMRYAIELAKIRQANIELLHVYPIPISAPDAPAEMILGEQIMDDARQRLDALVNGSKDANIKIETKLVAGSAGSEIVYYAEQTHPDLIILGTHGASQKKNRWIGSNTLHVIDRATSPVLAVPENIVAKLWKRICCATDFDYHEIDAIKQLSGWVKLNDAELVLVHINNDNTNDNDRSSAVYRESFIEKVRQLTGLAAINYEYIATHINLTDELREYAVFSNADVLVMLHHVQKGLSRLWHKSLTKEMAKELPMPLLSYPILDLEMETDANV